MSARRVVPLLIGTQLLDRCVALGGPPTGMRDRIPIPYAMGEPDPGCYRRDDYAGPGVAVRFRAVDGDEEVLPGITVLATPGHSPGHLSLLVRLASGRAVLIASDAGDLRENFDRELPPGILLAGRGTALASIRRLCRIAEDTGALLIPGHDPVAWAALPAELT